MDDYYNKKKAEISTTISVLKKVDVSAAYTKDQVDKANKVCRFIRFKMPGFYGDLGNVDPALMKQLHDLQRLNSNMKNYFSNINTNFGGVGKLSQAVANSQHTKVQKNLRK